MVREDKPKRPWHRFSIRALLVVILCVAIACGWFGVKLHIAREQQYAAATIQSMGADVGYDYNQVRAPEWLIRLVGVDCFRDVATVHVYKNTNLADADLELLKKFPALRCLYINRTSITNTGLMNLQGLTNFNSCTSTELASPMPARNILKA